jgi:hypothetical protein
MTETFVAMIAMMVASFVAFGTAVVVTAAFVAWRDWQRARALWNCHSGQGHRLDGVGQHLKPRF